MEASGKLTAQIKFRQWEDSAEGKADFKANITDNGVTEPVNIEEAVKHVRDRFYKDADIVYREAVFMHQSKHGYCSDSSCRWSQC